VTLEDCAVTKSTRGIRRNLKVGEWSPLGVLKEAATIPRLEKLLPPGKVKEEVLIETNRVVMAT